MSSASNETSGTAPRRGARQLVTKAAFRTLIRRPRWFFANLVQGPEILRDKRRETGVRPFAARLVPEQEAMSAILGIGPDEYRKITDRLWIPSPDPSEPLSVWNAREELLRMIGAAVSVLRPRVVLETGVALGYSTAAVLRLMADLDQGHLYSIDLPALQYDPDYEVGRAVPHELKDRWTLRLGDSRAVLPELAREASPIDIAIHDALHTYTAQGREYRAVWPHLRPGGVLISDDVGNPAFVEFADEVGVGTALVLGSNRETAVGVVRKPDAT